VITLSSANFTDGNILLTERNHTIQILTGAEVNVTQLRGKIFQCWSRLTVDICFVISLSKIR